MALARHRGYRGCMTSGGELIDLEKLHQSVSGAEALTGAAWSLDKRSCLVIRPQGLAAEVRSRCHGIGPVTGRMSQLLQLGRRQIS